jgi:2'-5' RNA ligase
MQELTSPHAMVFVDPLVAGTIEAVRREWDLGMATAIAAHVTVAYPRDIATLEAMEERVRIAATRSSPFRLALRAARCDGQPGLPVVVVVDIDDPDGGWRRLRDAILDAETTQARPHVTLVHPRTSSRAAEAWPVLQQIDFAADFTVRTVSVTAFDGRVWQTIRSFELVG